MEKSSGLRFNWIRIGLYLIFNRNISTNQMHRISFPAFIIIITAFLTQSCQKNEDSRAEILFDQQCARCHIAPDIRDLPKNIWQENILPDMGARMGISTPGYDPYKGYSYEETVAMMKTSTYPRQPVISQKDWNLLTDYILSLAPETLRKPDHPIKLNLGLKQFKPEAIKLDENPGSFITYLEYLPEEKKLALGDLQNQLRMFDFEKAQITRTIKGSSPIVSYNKIAGNEYITQIGRLNPSEISAGEFSKLKNDSVKNLKNELHRPVHTSASDLDKNGTPEFIVSEFGHFTGKVRMLERKNDSVISKTLLNVPGTIRTVIQDMNNDGKKDIVALTSQGDESITILFQDNPLEFRSEKVIRFSPIYGTSWFELIDYDKDGDLDIATVHGDNADKSVIDKPYHGLRIHINDGNNNFEETYFFPLNGATRLLARDFDKDGDIDFAVIATFPDYNDDPIPSFVYLENKISENYDFTASTFKEVGKARWFLMDAGDIDNDGDLDIIISAFSYAFIPIPKEVQKKWEENDIDIIVLRNNLTPAM